MASRTCTAPRLIEAARQWFSEKLIDEKSIDLPFVESEVARPAAERLATLRSHRKGYPTDVAAEISWWAAYHEDNPPRRPPPAPSTLVRGGPKIGRNDPCPCGSGRKYKKCHGAT